MTRYKSLAIIFLAMIIVPNVSVAHTGIGSVSSFYEGVVHPFTGVDHLLAMFAIGLWGSQMGGKSLWALPTVFVSVMIVGGWIGASGMQIILVEAGILASILLLGVWIANAVTMPVTLAALTVGVFALFHGYTHGVEKLTTVTELPYIIGVALATLMLHVAGIASFQLLRKRQSEVVVRFVGGMIALTGTYMIVA